MDSRNDKSMGLSRQRHSHGKKLRISPFADGTGSNWKCSRGLLHYIMDGFAVGNAIWCGRLRTDRMNNKRSWLDLRLVKPTIRPTVHHPALRFLPARWMILQWIINNLSLNFIFFFAFSIQMHPWNHFMHWLICLQWRLSVSRCQFIHLFRLWNTLDAMRLFRLIQWFQSMCMCVCVYVCVSV